MSIWFLSIFAILLLVLPKHAFSINCQLDSPAKSSIAYCGVYDRPVKTANLDKNVSTVDIPLVCAKNAQEVASKLEKILFNDAKSRINTRNVFFTISDKCTQVDFSSLPDAFSNQDIHSVILNDYATLLFQSSQYIAFIGASFRTVNFQVPLQQDYKTVALTFLKTNIESIDLTTLKPLRSLEKLAIIDSPLGNFYSSDPYDSAYSSIDQIDLLRINPKFYLKCQNFKNMPRKIKTLYAMWENADNSKIDASKLSCAICQMSNAISQITFLKSANFPKILLETSAKSAFDIQQAPPVPYTGLSFHNTYISGSDSCSKTGYPANSVAGNQFKGFFCNSVPFNFTSDPTCKACAECVSDQKPSTNSYSPSAKPNSGDSVAVQVQTNDKASTGGNSSPGKASHLQAFSILVYVTITTSVLFYQIAN